MFTRDQIEEIKKKLIMLGTKDTQFPDAHKLNGEEIVAIVQDGENKKIPLSSIINDDFINVSKDTTEILTLSTAVSKIDTNNRKLGQVITFKDSANSWAIRQFTGSSLDNWNDISLWKSISGIDELKSQVETNAEDISVLSDEIGRHDTSILNLNTDVSKLKDKDIEISNSLSGLTTRVDTLKSQADTNTSNISSLNTEVSTLQSKVDEHTESINAKITTDRIEDGAVTIDKIESSIQSLISNISKNATFAGIATPTTNPGTPEGPVFYFATQAGTYANFGGIEVVEGEASILQWSNGTWSKNATNFATIDKIAEVDADIKQRYGEIIERNGFVYAIIDAEGKLLFGIMDDGSIYQCKIEEHTNRQLGLLKDSIHSLSNELNNKAESLSNEIASTNNSLSNKITSTNNSLSKAEGEIASLKNFDKQQTIVNENVDANIKIAEVNSVPVYPSDVNEIIDDYIYIYAVTDNNKRLLFGVRGDGSFEWSSGIPTHLKDYIEKAVVTDIVPKGNSTAIQKSDYILEHGILGISWPKSFASTDNPFIGINWMLDNLDIAHLRTSLSITDILSETKMKVFNSCIKIMNERNIPVKVSCAKFPTWKGVEGKVSMEDFIKVVDEILSYDGNHDKILMDGSTYKCHISEICFLDEVEDHVGHTPSEILELLDYLVSYAKAKRNDIVVHSPSSGHYDPFYHIIGSLRLENGNCFSNLFDTYDIDIWTKDIDSNTKDILKAYSIADPINSYEKKMSAVVGFSTIAYTQDEQAINYFKHTLKYLSYGADVFSPFSPEYYVGEYYILEPILSNASHLYIRRGDNSEMSITDGDGYDDIILRFGANNWTSNATIIMSTVSAKPLKIVDNLKNYGIWISGSSGLSVSKVSIVHQNGNEDIIWQGSNVDVSSSPLVITKDSFNSIVSTDKVVISTNANTATGLTGIVPRKAAICFKHLCKILHKGCTRPTIKTFGDTTIAMWNDDSQRPIYALWSESESTEIPVNIEGNYYITDIYGNVKDINEVSSISEPIIIMNSSNIKLK